MASIGAPPLRTTDRARGSGFAPPLRDATATQAS